jgi:hypothetical protein
VKLSTTPALDASMPALLRGWSCLPAAKWGTQKEIANEQRT